MWLVLLSAAAALALLKIFFTRLPVTPATSSKDKMEDVLLHLHGAQNSKEVPNQKKLYDLKGFDFPAVTGLPFKIFTYLSYTRFGKYVLGPRIVKSSNLNRMAVVQIPEKPTFLPIPDMFTILEDYSSVNQKIIKECMEIEIKKGIDKTSDFHLPTVADYVRAYRTEQTTPSAVARNVLDAIAASDGCDPPLRAVVQSDRDEVLKMAAASDMRWKKGETLSYLDGVPVAVKEEICCKPYDLRGGASFTPSIGKGVEEAACVQKLKAAGAVIIGMTNMHEFGAGTLGSNPHPPHLTARNPYDPKRYAGGSSTGSAVSVAAGFCPVAIGTDGGGSVRVPAAVCGTVGLKPTFGVVDPSGSLPTSFTVRSLGPLTSSVLDTAITIDIISRQPNVEKTVVSLKGLGEPRLDGLKVGVFWDHFNDADPDIVNKCNDSLKTLEELGAELVDIVIPEMEDSRIAHAISIASEVGSSLGLDIDNHYSEINPETHLLVANAVNMLATEYINSQRQRTRAMHILKELFKTVDVIVTPAIAGFIPVIRPEAMSAGIADGCTGAKMMQYNFLGNLTGIPGIVLPVGYTEEGLPVGMQLMASWYREDLLLKSCWALEHSRKQSVIKPKIFYDVINK